MGGPVGAVVLIFGLDITARGIRDSSGSGSPSQAILVVQMQFCILAWTSDRPVFIFKMSPL